MSEIMIISLVQAARSGDRESSYELWQVLRPLRESWVRQTYLEYWSKEDLEQQSYLILIDALEKYDEALGMAFAGYYKVRLKVWKSKQKKRKTCESSNVESIEKAMLNHSDGSEACFEEVEQNLLLQEVMEKLEELEEREREFFIDSVIKNINYKLLIEKYGLTHGSVRSKRKRMIDKIKRNIEKTYK